MSNEKKVEVRRIIYPLRGRQNRFIAFAVAFVMLISTCMVAAGSVHASELYGSEYIGSELIDLENDVVEDDEAEGDEIDEDEVEDDEIENDEIENDEVEDDEIEDDKVEDDEVEDETENDEIEDDDEEDEYEEIEELGISLFMAATEVVGTIEGLLGHQLQNQTVRITLDGDTFAPDVVEGYNATGWFTLPVVAPSPVAAAVAAARSFPSIRNFGATVVSVDTDREGLTLAITGTPVRINPTITAVTIPDNRLDVATVNLDVSIASGSAGIFDIGMERDGASNILRSYTITINPDSPTGVYATFVYHNPGATAVQFRGELRLVNSMTVPNPTGNASVAEEHTQFPEQFTTDHVPGAQFGGIQGWRDFSRNMEYFGDGYWVVTLPLSAGSAAYWFAVRGTIPNPWYPNFTQGTAANPHAPTFTNTGTAFRDIYDPEWSHPNGFDRCPRFHVWSNRLHRHHTQSTVHVPWMPVQGDLHEARQVTLPHPNPAQRGTVVTHRFATPNWTHAIIGGAGNAQNHHYVLVYLPPGYNPNRAEPYPTLYMAHGNTNDAMDWMFVAGGANMMDNLIASGDISPTVMVSVNWQHHGLAGYRAVMMNNLVPSMEDNFNVSTRPEHRAVGGFSFGGRFAAELYSAMANGRPDDFGYIIPTSTHTPPSVANLTGAPNNRFPQVFIGHGMHETAGQYGMLSTNFANAGIPHRQITVRGGHDQHTFALVTAYFLQNHVTWEARTPEITTTNAAFDLGVPGNLSLALDFGAGRLEAGQRSYVQPGPATQAASVRQRVSTVPAAVAAGAAPFAVTQDRITSVIVDDTTLASGDWSIDGSSLIINEDVFAGQTPSSTVDVQIIFNTVAPAATARTIAVNIIESIFVEEVIINGLVPPVANVPHTAIPAISVPTNHVVATNITWQAYANGSWSMATEGRFAPHTVYRAVIRLTTTLDGFAADIEAVIEGLQEDAVVTINRIDATTIDVIVSFPATGDVVVNQRRAPRFPSNPVRMPRPPEPVTIPANDGEVSISLTQTADGNVTLSTTSTVVTNLIDTASNNTVVLDMSDLDEVTVITLPVSALEQFAEADLGLEVILPDGSILILDAEDLAYLVESADTDNVQIDLADWDSNITPPPIVDAPVVPSVPQPVQLRFEIDNPAFTRNGELTIDQEGLAPFIDPATNRTMVPLRLIAEALGANVTFNDDTRTATVTRGDVVLQIQIDSALPDGMGSPMIVNDRTFVPVAYVSQMLGANVRWDEENRAVYIQ
ncbi:MAG: stalk domain-containing protein [Defluviitaleaceae bacterium]|nr:stalk domain-containing protein [Defluviitaleaceae bacterium]